MENEGYTVIIPTRKNTYLQLPKLTALQRVKNVWNKLSGKPPIQPPALEFKMDKIVVGNMKLISERASRVPKEIIDGPDIEVFLPLIHKHINDLIYIAALGLQNNCEIPANNLLKYLKRNCDLDTVLTLISTVMENIGFDKLYMSIIAINGPLIIKEPTPEPDTLSELKAFKSRFDQTTLTNHIETN